MCYIYKLINNCVYNKKIKSLTLIKTYYYLNYYILTLLNLKDMKYI